MQEVSVRIDFLLKSDAPERCRTPLVAASQAADVVVVQADAHNLASHVVQEEIAVRMNRLAAQPRQFCAVEERCAARSGMERRDVTEMTLRFVEHLFANRDEFPLVDGAAFICGRLLCATQSSGRHAESVQVEVHVLHVLGRDVEMVIEQSHHRTLLHLRLSLAYLFGVTAVGCAHVRREAKLDGQVRVLCFVARQSQLTDAAFGDVIASAAYPVLRIVRLRRELFYLVTVQSHHLAHANVPKRNANCAEELFWIDGLACLSVAFIPVGNGVLGICEAVRLTVREGELLFVPPTFQLSFSRHAVDALVVQHAAIVLEEGAVLSRHIDKHRTEPVAAGTINRRSIRIGADLRPKRRLCPARVAMTRTTRVTRIDRTKPACLRQGIIVETVSVDEAA